jgi:hypothetical protein
MWPNHTQTYLKPHPLSEHKVAVFFKSEDSLRASAEALKIISQVVGDKIRVLA